MTLFVLPFLVGVLLVQQAPVLPSYLALPATAAALLVVPLLRRPGWGVLLAGMVAGLAWAGLHAIMFRPPAIAGMPEGPFSALVEGDVVSLPQVRGEMTRFEFLARRLTVGGRTRDGSWRLRLSWQNAPPVVPGQRWTLPLRIRRAVSYGNPGSWDYAGWLYRRGILYTAYVRDRPAAVLHGAGHCCGFERLRHYLSELVSVADMSPRAVGLVRALTLGDRGDLDSADRALFTRLGISHLVAISGLHIGLLAALVYLPLNAAWRRMPFLVNRVPAVVAAATGGLLAGAAYAVLAGFGLPAQRALVMLGVAWLAVVSRRRVKAREVLATAALLILLHAPTAVLEAGFWLSFGAVGAILAGLALLRDQPAWARLLGLQCIIGLALYPILTWFGMSASALAPLVNLPLVPLFGFLLIPAALLGVLLGPVAGGVSGVLLAALGWGIDGLFLILEWLDARGQGLVFSSRPGMFALGAWVLATLVLLAPRGFPLRVVSLPLFVLAAWPRGPDLAPGELRFTLLDVGQGMSAVVETHRHTLVYDTGPTYRSGFNTADAVVSPYLRYRGLRRIDRLVLSHGDNDHASGAQRLLDAWPVLDVLAGEPERTPVPARACLAGERWTWDGVVFEILYPPGDASPRGNNASCVILVTHARGRMLLTGDIEDDAEAGLVQRVQEAFPLDLVTAPHHGSATSSTAPFVRASGARHVLFPVGRGNRYGFPRADVSARWSDAGASLWRSDRHGAVVVEFGGSDNGQPRSWRSSHRHYWE